MHKIFVIGSINMDIVIGTDRFPKAGETIHGRGLMFNGGGKGANQAVAVQKLGGELRYCACVGDDMFGRQLMDTLRGYGVDTSGMVVLPGVSSGVALITVAEGNNTIVIHAGANDGMSAEIAKNFLNTAERGDYLLLQLEVPPETVTEVMACAKEKGMVVLLNPAPSGYFRKEMLEYTDYLIPNETELCDISGEDSVEKAVAAFGSRQIRLIVTLGEHGCMYAWNGETKFYPAEKVKAVDSTAAGDTFCGAFAVSLSRGEGIEQAIAFAQRAAALSVTRKGAQQSIPTRKEILAD